MLSVCVLVLASNRTVYSLITWLVFVLCVSVSASNGTAYSLITDLLREYDKDVRPVSKWDEPLELNLDIALRQIIELVSE